MGLLRSFHSLAMTEENVPACVNAQAERYLENELLVNRINSKPAD